MTNHDRMNGVPRVDQMPTTEGTATPVPLTMRELVLRGLAFASDHHKTVRHKLDAEGEQYRVSVLEGVEATLENS